jgi:hypothetical protein
VFTTAVVSVLLTDLASGRLASSVLGGVAARATSVAEQASVLVRKPRPRRGGPAAEIDGDATGATRAEERV